MTTKQKIEKTSAEWFAPIDPYDFQWEIYRETINYIRNYDGPAYIYASVSAGKTLMMAMIAKHAQQMAELANKLQMPILCIARTGELVEQNADEMWGINARCSIFSASVGRKSTKYPTVVGSEGTVCRALDKELKYNYETKKGFAPGILLWDECHQVGYDDENSQAMQIITELKRRNPALRIIGYTGSPWRGTEPIKGKFWKHQLYKIDMWELVKLGFVDPPIFGFGHDDVKYDYSSIEQRDKDGTEDFGKEQMAAMQKIATADHTRTQKIMQEVIELTRDRNCVLITCAGSKHIKECASMLPEGSYATITERTTYKDRKVIKEGCDTGKIKYVLQIGCWTVGVNIPPIDTIVILRRIGSLTLLTQLIGRGIRKLKQRHLDLGMLKKDCCVLDYSDTMEKLGELFNDPILEAAQKEKSVREGDELNCPRCEKYGLITVNSSFARRCIGPDLKPNVAPRLAPDPRGMVTGKLILKQPDGRCGFFWSSKPCPKCGIENDKVARSCRQCDHQLIDPNENLNGKHYTDDDYKPVLGHKFELTKNQEGLVITYQLPDNEVAVEVFHPKSDNQVAKRIYWNEFVKKHVTPAWQNKFYGRPARAVIGMKALIDWPKEITHRINDKGKSVIHRKRFNSGREAVSE